MTYFVSPYKLLKLVCLPLFAASSQVGYVVFCFPQTDEIILKNVKLEVFCFAFYSILTKGCRRLYKAKWEFQSHNGTTDFLMEIRENLNFPHKLVFVKIVEKIVQLKCCQCVKLFLLIIVTLSFNFIWRCKLIAELNFERILVTRYLFTSCLSIMGLTIMNFE